MTNTLKIALQELEKQPPSVQESWGARILSSLAARSQPVAEPEQTQPYSFLDVLLDAKLDGPADASVTYEDVLYSFPEDDQ